jgi:hypothetical protein
MQLHPPPQKLPADTMRTNEKPLLKQRFFSRVPNQLCNKDPYVLDNVEADANKSPVIDRFAT